MQKLNILSHGAGVQTSCMVYMVLEGDLPHPDVIIFADPKWELKATYDYLQKVIEDVRGSGIPMMIESGGDIYEDTIRSAITGERAPSMPFFTESGIVDRQCTNDYKIDVVRRAARKYLGLKPRQKTTHKLVMWKGITTDEIERITDSKVSTEEYRYPLFELGMNRQDCMNYLQRKGYGIPPKSSCVGCPYHSDQTWVDIYRQHPEEFAKAVELDRTIRNHKKFNQKLYLHRSRMDLEKAVHQASRQGDLFYDFEGFRNDCNGVCGV